MLSERLHPQNLSSSRFFNTLWLCCLLWLSPGAPRAADFIASGSTALYYKRTSEPSPANIPAWRDLDFNDATWASGAMPFYYGEDLAGVNLSDMRSNYTTVY